MPGNFTAGSEIPRLLARIDRVPGSLATECWVSTYKPNSDGYVRVGVHPRRRDSAHRLMYEHYVGPIPDGLEIDHLCRVRNCINPEHLEVVTHKENMRRSQAPCWVAHMTGVCARGHSLDNALRNGRCRTCRYERETFLRHARKASVLPGYVKHEGVMMDDLVDSLERQPT